MNKEELAAHAKVLARHQMAEAQQLREEVDSRLKAEAVARFGKDALGPWAALLLKTLEWHAQGLRPEEPIDAGTESLIILILRCLATRSIEPLAELERAISAVLSVPEGEVANRELLMLVETHRTNLQLPEEEKIHLHQLPQFEDRQKQFRKFRDLFKLDIPSRGAHRPDGSMNVAH